MSAARPVEDRFWEKVNLGCPDDCWEWTASRLPKGYGQFGVAKGHQVYAHRFAYELVVGPIPTGLHIDHLCNNKSCCNPAHLEPVTPRENTRRWAATITHCKNGHEYTLENTYRRRDTGGRQCKECERTVWK